MATPIIGDIIEGTIGKVVDRLAERYLPSPLGEKEREELRLEAQRLAADELRSLGDIEKVYSDDRKSAREREAAVKDRTPAVLAGVSFFGFFSMLALMMLVRIPENAKDPLLIMLGALGAIVTGITQYYYGSSTGSARKNDMLEKFLKNN